MKFHSGWAWMVLIPLAILVIYELFIKETKRASLQFSALKLVRGISPGLRARFRWVPTALKAAALAFAVIALARPQESNTKVNRTIEGIDIVLALDVSESMYIEDMEPENRLMAAKDVIHKFVKKRTSDRVGLVIFGGEAFTACPPTLDYEVLLKTLSEVVPEQVKQGTAIGVGLATAVGRLKDSTAKSRVVIFLTDGENNSGTIDPATATEMAKGYGIKIYSIGLGRDGQAQLPQKVVDPFTGKIRKTYTPIHSTVNDTLLTQMADSTGGKYWRAETTDALRGVFSEIDRLEKTKIQTNEYTKYTELFTGWLMWAVLFYALQLLLSTTVLRRAP